MSQPDVIIRGGTLITHKGVRAADVAVAGGKIVTLGEDLPGAADETIDARGLHIFPGLIDSHVHFNDPGRSDWEGIETGSRALAAGGGTMFFDMPLNSSPPTLDAAGFDGKLTIARETSLTDFALWGGLTPNNLHCLEVLAERGVIGFKAFMSNSGIEDFSSVDDATLKEGMKRVAKRGKLVAVHAESDTITQELTKAALAQKRTTIRDYLDSRPIYAELDAIHRAIQLAGETKCALHIVHVSSGAGVALVASARKQGVDVTCETCPHYLVLREEDVEALGAVAKCAPPLRTKSAQDVLWRYVESGEVRTIGSDHSPSPPEMKLGKNFFKIWGGISGVQHTLPLLLTEFTRRIADWQSAVSRIGNPPAANVSTASRLPVSDTADCQSAIQAIAALTSFNVVERFKLPSTKGRIAVGADADLALVDLKTRFTVRAEDLLYRHQQSPYVGRALTGRVVRTILRGQTIFRDGKIVAPPMGQFVKPQS